MWSQLVLAQNVSYKIHEYPAVMREALKPFSEIERYSASYTYQNSFFTLAAYGFGTRIGKKSLIAPFDSSSYYMTIKEGSMNSEVVLFNGITNETITVIKVVNESAKRFDIMMDFSMDGKFAYVLTKSTQKKDPYYTVNVYVFNLETSTLESDGIKIPMYNQPVLTEFITSFDGNIFYMPVIDRYFVLELKSGKYAHFSLYEELPKVGKLVPRVNEYVETSFKIKKIYPSIDSDNIILLLESDKSTISDNPFMVLFDVNTKEIILSSLKYD